MTLDKPDAIERSGERQKIKAPGIRKFGTGSHPLRPFAKPTLLAHLLLKSNKRCVGTPRRAMQLGGTKGTLMVPPPSLSPYVGIPRLAGTVQFASDSPHVALRRSTKRQNGLQIATGNSARKKVVV